MADNSTARWPLLALGLCAIAAAIVVWSASASDDDPAADGGPTSPTQAGAPTYSLDGCDRNGAVGTVSNPGPSALELSISVAFADRDGDFLQKGTYRAAVGPGDTAAWSVPLRADVLAAAPDLGEIRCAVDVEPDHDHAEDHSGERPEDHHDAKGGPPAGSTAPGR